MKKIVMGCVADDFTGASDLASFLQEAGACCLLINGLPEEGYSPPLEYDVVVIALKTRSVEVDTAVEQNLQAFDWLVKQKASMLYFKYCSTFDSTPSGNIGPVLDALLEKYSIPFTVLCPSLPVYGRTVKDGILYVEGVPLSESSMKDHPINPMWDSYIPNLMKAQSRYPTYIVTYELKNDELLRVEEIHYDAQDTPFYLVPDYYEEEHGEILASHFSTLRLASGGSALPPYIYRCIKNKENTGAEIETGISPRTNKSRGLILSGSCSKVTQGQIQKYIHNGNLSIRLLPSKLIDGTQTIEDVWKEIALHETEDILVYSCEESTENPPIPQSEISAVLETAVSKLGCMAVASGIKNLVVAGGETSGAVIQNLKITAFGIGPAVAPGVPVLYPQNLKEIQIALKSGNFGEPDFFTQALQMMKGEK